MRVAALAAVAAAALWAPAAALATPVLDPADAAELAQSLADATEEQGVCYGWEIEVDDASGGPSGPEYGSNLGPQQRFDLSQCPKYAVLVGTIVFTSDSSDSEDASRIEVRSNLPGITQESLDELGYGANDSLVGDDNDTVLANMVGALPEIVADHGYAPPVPFETPAAPVEQQGAATGRPRLSDFLRQWGPALLICSLLLVGGAVWLVVGVEQRRRRRHAERRERRGPARPAQAPDGG